MDRSEAVLLAIQRFPFLRDRVDDSGDLFELTHMTYGLIAAELLRDPTDESLFEKVCAFINELTASKDETLEEYLVIDVLESLAQDEDIAKRLKSRLNEDAKTLLSRVEAEFFKRL